MKYLIVLVGILFASVSTSVQADEQSKARGQEFLRKIEAYRSEAASRSASEIFDEIRRVREIQRLRIDSGESMWVVGLNEEGAKSAGYAKALKEKREKLEIDASYYHGLHNLPGCGILQSASEGKYSKIVEECYKESLDSFLIASDGGAEAATLVIGLMYEKGWGVGASNYIAADWYIKAARQASLVKNRNLALRSIENALRVFPNNSVALKLREELFK
jgi:TPR repeat protein